MKDSLLDEALIATEQEFDPRGQPNSQEKIK